MNLSDRFWAKVQKGEEHECWIWTGRLHRSGYGALDFDGKTRAAHRVSWLLYSESDAGDMYVLHRCDNRACVNPQHLFLGTHDENMRDMVSKERQNRGSSRHNAKLSESDVLEIKASTDENVDLAARFGISYKTIHHIKSGRRWSHINPAA